MIVKYYGLYDTIAKEYINTITSKNDATAERSCEYIVRDPKFDKIRGKDLVLIHLYDFDNCSGKVVENDLKTICALASAMASYEAEKLTESAVQKEIESDGRES